MRFVHNKSFLTNTGCLLLAIAGGLFYDTGIGYIMMTGGLYGFSGAITNWLAIYMLFEKIPFLYGSGIITLRFESFKAHIRTMMMETFFREEDLQAHVGKLAGRLKQSFNPEQLAASVDMNILFDELISLAEESTLGGMLSVFGGRKLLESMRAPFCEKAGQKIPGIIRNAFNDAHIDPLKLVPVSEIRELIADAVERKLEELTPQHVKEIVENMIREHLGWLVFWGGVFGFLIGVVSASVQILF